MSLKTYAVFRIHHDIIALPIKQGPDYHIKFTLEKLGVEMGRTDGLWRREFAVSAQEAVSMALIHGLDVPYDAYYFDHIASRPVYRDTLIANYRMVLGTVRV